MILLSISVPEPEDVKIGCVYNSVSRVLDTYDAIVAAFLSVGNFKR